MAAALLEVGGEGDGGRRAPVVAVPSPGAQVVRLVLRGEVDLAAGAALQAHPVRGLELVDGARAAERHPAVRRVGGPQPGAVRVGEEHVARADDRVPGEVEGAVTGEVAERVRRVVGRDRSPGAGAAVVGHGRDAPGRPVHVADGEDEVVARGVGGETQPAHGGAGAVGRDGGRRAPARGLVPDAREDRVALPPDRHRLAGVVAAQGERHVDRLGRVGPRPGRGEAQDLLRAPGVRVAVPDPPVDGEAAGARAHLVRDPDESDLVGAGPGGEAHPVEDAGGGSCCSRACWCRSTRTFPE